MKPAAKKVFLGKMKGETPRKETFFSSFDAPNAIGSASPLRVNPGSLPIKSALMRNAPPVMMAEQDVDARSTPPKAPARMPDRPTTSRGKARPSPDEFADYVQPSPQKELDKCKVVFFTDNDDGDDARIDASSADLLCYREQDDLDAFADSLTGGAWRDVAEDCLRRSVTGGGVGDDSNNIPGNPGQAEPDEFRESGACNDNAISSDQLNALRGCWLFGSALSI